MLLHLACNMPDKMLASDDKASKYSLKRPLRSDCLIPTIEEEKSHFYQDN